MAVYLNFKKKLNKLHYNFFVAHTKQSKASIERFQSSVTHLDPSETLQESSKLKTRWSLWRCTRDLHARDQEQTMMSSCALAGVDLNPQLQHKTSKTDKSVIDH